MGKILVVDLGAGICEIEEQRQEQQYKYVNAGNVESNGLDEESAKDQGQQYPRGAVAQQLAANLVSESIR